MEHLRTERCKLKHFIIGNLVQLAGLWNNAGIGGINAVHIGIDLAEIRAERSGDSNGSGIGATAAERRNVVLFIDALESGNNDDTAPVEFGADPFRLYLADAGF